MGDTTHDPYIESIELTLKHAQDLHDRADEAIRKSEETLRAAKAILHELRDKLPRIA